MNNKLTGCLKEYSDKMDNSFYTLQLNDALILTNDIDYVEQIIQFNVLLTAPQSNVTILTSPVMTDYIDFEQIDKQNYAAIFMHDARLKKHSDYYNYTYAVVVSPNVDDLAIAVNQYSASHLKKFDLFEKAVEQDISIAVGNPSSYKVAKSENLIIDHLIAGNKYGTENDKPMVINRLENIFNLGHSVNQYCKSAMDMPNNSPRDLAADNDDDMEM